MPKAMEEIASKGLGKAKALKARARGLKGVFKTLAEEHGELSALLRRVSTSKDTATRSRLFPRIRAELLAHERAELTELYPLLREHSETRAIADAHERDTREMAALIDDLSARTVDDPEWGTRFDQLAELIEYHALHEEDDYFPVAQEVLGVDTAKDLVAIYLAKKQAGLKRLGQ